MDHTALVTPLVDELKVRDRLLEAAIRLFAEKGYAATSVSEIVAAAGVTKPILYYYFKSKEGLYLEILRAAFTPFTAMLEEAARSQGSARERILALARHLYADFVKNIEAARVIMAVFYSPSQGAPTYDIDVHRLHHIRTMRQIVEQGIAAGEFKAHDSEEIALGIIGLIWLVLDLELTGKGIDTRLGRPGMENLLQMFFSGIAVPAAAGKGNE